MSLEEQINDKKSLIVKQIREVAEIFGYETRNKYIIETEDGDHFGNAEESGSGWFGFFIRQFLGHFRSFDIVLEDRSRNTYIANYPFRFYFNELIVNDSLGKTIGKIKKKFTFFKRRFEITDPNDNVIFIINSNFTQFWTFEAIKTDALGKDSIIGKIEKKWSGILKEAFTDGDKFKVSFITNDKKEKILILMSALLIDLLYFEKKS